MEKVERDLRMRGGLKGLPHRMGILLVVTLVFLLSVPLSAWAKGPVGTIVTLTQTVEIKPAGAEEWRALKLKDKIYVGNLIRTGENSRVKIFFVDDSTISLGPLSTLKIEEHLFNAAENYRNSKFKLLLGKARVHVRGFFSPDSKYEVHTPTAVAGVKGTKFIVWVKSPVLTTVGVIQGQVAVANSLPHIPGEVLLTGNLATDVPINKPPQPPKPMDTQQMNNLQKDVATKGQTDGTKAGGVQEIAGGVKAVGKLAATPPPGTPGVVGGDMGEVLTAGTIQTNIVDTPPENSVQVSSHGQQQQNVPVNTTTTQEGGNVGCNLSY